MILEPECKKYNDIELVEHSLSNSDYYACLVNRYTEALRRYVLRLGSTPFDSEDVLQEVFLNAYMHLNDFDKKLKFSSWIYRIAHNQVIDCFRKKHNKPTVELTDLEPWQEMVLDSCPGCIIDQEILSKKVKIILGKLDSRYREVIVLKYFEEKDYVEMSDILRKPMGTIATLVSRAKKQFTKLAEDQLLNR
ncbi:MAG: RNA polymerase sigma factor [bacterium]